MRGLTAKLSHEKRPIAFKKVAFKDVIKFAAFFVLFILFANADCPWGYSPFALGFFVGLVYSRQNILILTPLYLLAQLSNDFSLYTFIYSITPCVILTVCYFACYRLSRPVTLAILAICTLLSQTPFIVIECLNTKAYAAVAINAGLALLFGFASEMGCYAVLIRGLNYRLSIDERVALGIMLLGLSVGVYSVPIYGFNFYYAFSALLTLFLAVGFSSDVALTAALICGAGAYLASGNLAIAAETALACAAALPFKQLSRFASAAGILIIYTMLALYYLKDGFDYLKLISVLLGLIIYLVMPKRVTETLAAKMGGLSHRVASRYIVNQNRTEMSIKLKNMAEIFKNMSSLLKSETDIAGIYDPEKISADVAVTFCGKCPEREGCFSMLGGDTRSVLFPMAEAAMAHGKITILDTPPFVSSRCVRPKELTKAVLNSTLEAKRRVESAGAVLDGKLMLAEQFGGVATIMDELSKDIRKRVNFSLERENRIISELARHNIIAQEAAVYGEGDKLQVTLLVRECDAEKLILEKVVSQALGQKMERGNLALLQGDPKERRQSEWRTVYLASAPLYSIAFGVASEKREGEQLSGDSQIITKLDDGKLLIALSDGMGGGAEAAKTSNATISLIENFYRAGFDSNMVLPTVNRFLSLREREDFSTLDITVIDRATGIADVIKLGAAESYIVRGEEITALESHSLPVGILERISPTIERVRLDEKDMFVMVSDGISEALGEGGVEDVIEEAKTQNPQTLADILVQKAKACGAGDDCTAIAFRLILPL